MREFAKYLKVAPLQKMDKSGYLMSRKVVIIMHLSPTLEKELHMLAKLNHMSILSGAARVLPQWLAQRWTKPVMTQAQDEYLVGQTG